MLFGFGLIALVIPVMKLPPGYCLFANIDLNLQPGKINRMQSLNTSVCTFVSVHTHTCPSRHIRA